MYRQWRTSLTRIESAGGVVGIRWMDGMRWMTGLGWLTRQTIILYPGLIYVESCAGIDWAAHFNLECRYRICTVLSTTGVFISVFPLFFLLYMPFFVRPRYTFIFLQRVTDTCWTAAVDPREQNSSRAKMTTRRWDYRLEREMIFQCAIGYEYKMLIIIVSPL